MLGYSRDQIIGMHAKDIIVPAEAKYINPALKKITSNQKYKREWQFKRKDGSTFFADVMVTVMPGGNLLAMVHDITERKKAEKEIFAESRLNESILTSMLDGFILADTEGKLQRVNPAYCNMIGYSESELLSMNIRDLEVSIPEKEMSRRIESMVKKGSDRFETKHKRKDGKTIWLNVSILIIQSENKNMVAAFVQDISESKRNEQLLQQKTEEIEAQNEEYLQVNEELRQTNEELVNAKDKAEESDKLKTAFLQNMSHEIRTPMNAIMGFSDLMVQHLNDKEKLKSFTQIVSQRSNDLLNVLDDILDISRIESGQLPIHVEECNLDDLFLSLSGFFSERKRNMGKQHIQLSLQNHCNDTENLILTDGVKLRQIFINLLSNALKFTHEGVIEGGCRYNEDHQLQFYVSDTGIGIPHDKQDRVFERFYQVLLDRNIGGTGLGLPIVKGLVELLGGKIELVSEPGKGSVFTFSINYKKSKPSDDRKTSVMDTEVFDFSDKTILIVEDDPYNSEYLKEIISATDAKILHSFSGNESVQMAISEQVDIVLMDVRLPDMDGYEATRQIINLKPQTKIIAQTAYAQQGEKLKAHEAGCIDYISKPTKKKQLLTLIKKHLQS